mmetsp:Transcript_41266/g.94967  ORF Transcript_41266/g.94967 Transcript_41266/m.94967 type:complete len:215 (-) Transcript_41266:332-976(-)
MLRLDFLGEELLEKVLRAIEKRLLELLQCGLLLPLAVQLSCLLLLTLPDLCEFIQLVAFLCLRDSLTVNEHVVKVLKVCQVCQHMRVVGVVLADLVSFQADAAQVCKLSQVVYLLELPDLVVAKRQNVELRTAIQAFDLLDLVVVQRQVGQVAQLLQSFNLADVVEGQIQPCQLLQMVQVYDSVDDVVVQAQCCEHIKVVEIRNLDDVQKGQPH